MKKNNKILYISIAILVLAIGIAFGTYAYYQTTISGTISGNVAKWSFKANNQTSNLNLDLGNLYPGVSNTYNIELSAENSDLDVYYELYIPPTDEWNDGWILYLRENGDWGSAGCSEDNDYVGIYGTISAGSKISIPVYLDWPYGNYAEEYYDEPYYLPIEIIGQQLTGYTGTQPLELYKSKYSEINPDVIYLNGYIEASDICYTGDM